MTLRIAARLWPDTLAARVVLVLLDGLTLFHLGSLWLHQADTETALDATQEALLGEQIAGALRVFGPGRSHAVAGAIALADGSWLNRLLLRRASAGVSRHASLLSTTAMAAGILIVGLLVVRNLNRPLRQFAEAANRITTPARRPPSFTFATQASRPSGLRRSPCG